MRLEPAARRIEVYLSTLYRLSYPGRVTKKVIQALKTDNLLVKLANLKKIQVIRVEFFAKIVKRSGPNKSVRKGKSLKIVKRSGSSNRHLSKSM